MSNPRVGNIGSRRGLNTGETGGVRIGGQSGRGGIKTQMSFIETRQLQSGNFAAARAHVLSGHRIQLFGIGIQTDNNTSPAGLKATVEDETNSVVIHEETSKGNFDRPLATREASTAGGPFDVIFKAINDTNSQQNVTAFFIWTITT